MTSSGIIRYPRHRLRMPMLLIGITTDCVVALRIFIYYFRELGRLLNIDS